MLPITVDPTRKEPLHRQIYEWFRRAIVNGQLRPGQRVPSTRALATELNVSRVPVLQAFDQLTGEGYLQTFRGAGTRVSSSIPQGAIGLLNRTARALPRREGPRKISRASERKRGSREPWEQLSGAFRPHLPALDYFPTDIWSRLVTRNARKRSHESMAYGSPMGFWPFREAIAEYLRVARGVRCEPQQVMVVSGSQQALYLSARVLLDPGEPVWLEEPGCPGAHQGFGAAGCQLVPVPVDAEGLDVDEGIRRCRGARAVYVTPSHQYPLGATMSAARRIHLLSWASRSGSWIIEDDYDSEFRQGIRPIASLQSLDTDARVIYVGTFSKALFPALRLGYVVVPSDLIRPFAAARDAMDIFPPTLAQAVLADFIGEGHFTRHIRRMRVLYEERCNVLVDALRAQMADLLGIANGRTGMHLVGLLLPRLRDVAVSRRAAAHGISVMPLSSCCLERPARRGLILGYGDTDRVQIQQGVRKLKVILQGMMEGSPSSSRATS
jgi:GntR family transcriptional regulator/MocR family aminotransferase